MNKTLFAFLALPGLAFAGQAILKWNPPSDVSGVYGYQVLYGTSPGVYGSPIDVPGPISTTGYTVSSLKNGVKYYFVVRSVNQDKTVFSQPSNEVSAVIPLGSPTSLTVTLND